MSYDRYSQFRVNGNIDKVPFVSIPKKDTDFYETYHQGVTRLDILSYNYYNDSDYAWLILQANPQYGAIEYEIRDGAVLRIPYPLKETLTDYETAIKKYKKLNS